MTRGRSIQARVDVAGAGFLQRSTRASRSSSRSRARGLTGLVLAVVVFALTWGYFTTVRLEVVR